MSPERWKQVEELFGRAVDLPREARARFVAEACGADEELREEVENLLRSDEEAGEFIEEPVFDVRNVTSFEQRVAEAGGPLADSRVGAYRLVREIGRGGMGSVYLAVRADDEFHRRVAIKLVKRGMDTDFVLRRFRNERQILASLDHPNIALLLDGGTTDDGLPYFVMEYIQGLPLDRYCDNSRLSIAERLRLFQRVCSAVSYAHENHVVHRDIKPSNILVTADGTPKLLDFGIAKILNPELSGDTVDPTLTAMRMMTPKYASPEQLRGAAASPFTDLYSLGVLLYELLTGHHPFRLAPQQPPHEVARIICDEEPELPSAAVARVEEWEADGETVSITPALVCRQRGADAETLRQELARGLDHILMKALRKEPLQRYESVADFAADLARYLAGAPVSAPASFPAPAESNAPAPRDPSKTAVAVLPFRMLHAFASGEDTGTFLGVGLADALITRLSNTRGVTVRPTSSVMRFAREEGDPVAAGRQLAADYVVDGHLLRAGGRVRATVQLIGVERGAPLWAARFDESDTDILSLHDSLSNQVARALVPRLNAGEDEERADDDAPARRGTRNPAAYEAYMRGRYHWNSMAEDGFARAIVHFNEAAALDPSYAAAHSGIADYYNWLGVLGVLPPRECYGAAKEAAARAAALDPSSSEAYAALGFASHAQCEWEASERHFIRAIELNPNYANAHQWYAFHLCSVRRFGEAVAASRRAQEIAHDSYALQQSFAWVCYQARQYDECLALTRKVLEADPGFVLGLYTESRALSAAGRHEEAVGAARRACEVSGGSPSMLGQLGHACALAGRTEEARGIIKQLGEMSRARYVSAYHLALVHTALGETDEALARLSEAAGEREAWLCWIRTEAALDPLRSDPRFLSLFERVLLQEWGTARGRPQTPEPVASPPHAVGPDAQAAAVTRPLPATEEEAEEVAAAVHVDDGVRHPPSRLVAAETQPRRRRKVRRLRYTLLHRAGLVAMGALLATLVAVAALIYFGTGGAVVNSVAVLPFANVHSDPDTEYISDGVAEHLINQLSQLPSLRVMARTTAFTYKGREVDPRRAGREMGVGAVLVGRVTKRGDVLLIQTELVRVEDGARLWGGSYMRKVSELPAVQHDIATEMLQSLKLRLSGEEQEQLARRRTQDAEAYQLYLQGEYHRNRATPDDLRRSVELFERSSARDPSNALTHVGLAFAYRSLPAYGVMLPQEAYPRARAAAQRALALDPQLASAHVPLASIKFVYDWKFDEAEAEYREALRLNPNHAEAHFAFANFLTAMERFDEAMEEYAEAERLDPFSVNIADGVVWSLFVAGRYDEAIARSQRNLERDPRHAQTYLHLGEIYTAQGRYGEAEAALMRARELSNHGLVEIALGHAYAVSGRREEALAIARDYEARVRTGRGSPFLLAVIYAGLDDKDAAFQWLEKSYEDRSNWMALLKVGRRLAPLHSDPRFRSLLDRVGFPK
jgi:serine/threonine protein kinase/tetratricopeptide (TPR) repeat protein